MEPGFVAAMNAKARRSGMRTRDTPMTGLSARNVSTANDLALLVAAAGVSADPRFQHHRQQYVSAAAGQILGSNNTNNLVKNGQWDIKLSKTG